MSISGPLTRRPPSSHDLVSAPGSTNLADLLERVLDKGVVVAGDIVIALGAVELLTLKVRLLIASIDKARELGIDWWEHDAFLSSGARAPALEGDTELLRRRLDHLERLLLAPPQEGDREHAEAAPWSTTAPAYVLDKQGKVIAELKPPLEQAQEEEQPPTQERAPQPAEQPQEEARPHAPERAPRAEVAQAEQPAGAGPLLGQALHERITHAEHLAQAVRPVLEGLPQRNAQAGQPGEQARPEGRHDEAQEPEEEQPHAPQPEAAQNPAPARALEEEGRKSATPRHGRVTWRLAVVDLDREGRVIAEPKQPVEQAQEDEQNAAPAYILDKQGRVLAELEQPVEQAQEDEGPQVQERTPQPEAAQAEQPEGAGPLLAPALHAHIAQAMQSVLAELRQRNAQAGQPGEQARPVARQDEAQPPEEEPPHALERAPQPEAAQTPAPASILDKQGRLISELKLPLERAQEDEGPLIQERAPQPEAAQAEQPAGAGPLLAPALHAHIAQAMQSVLEELRQRNAQARQPGEQARPVG